MRISATEENDLRRLYKYLDYELSSGALFLLIFVPGAGLLLTAAVLLLAPYMLYILYRTKKKTWLTSFIIFVFMPFLAGKLLIHAPEMKWIVPTVTLALFLFYCFVLRLKLGDMLRDISARRRWEIEEEIK